LYKQSSTKDARHEFIGKQINEMKEK